MIRNRGRDLYHFGSRDHAAQQFDSWLSRLLKDDSSVSSLPAPLVPVLHVPDDVWQVDLPGTDVTLHLPLRWVVGGSILVGLLLAGPLISKQSAHTRHNKRDWCSPLSLLRLLALVRPLILLLLFFFLLRCRVFQFWLVCLVGVRGVGHSARHRNGRTQSSARAIEPHAASRLLLLLTLALLASSAALLLPPLAQIKDLYEKHYA